MSELGRGGMGVVYRAQDTRLNRVVALKMLLAGSHSSTEQHQRFVREAQAVAGLTHPNILKLYEIGEHEGLPYMALEYCAGGSLETAIRGRPQPVRASVEIMAAVARGVAAAHDTGLIHRDLKPANVLFLEGPAQARTGQTPRLPDKPGPERALPAASAVKVADFGLAKQVGSAVLTATGAAIGTPTYMAPEQAEGQPLGPPADVYALGAILYEMLSGRPPLLGENEMHTLYMALSEEPVPLRQLMPSLPTDLETICQKCLHKDPKRRYGQAAELAEDLERYLAGQPILARPVGAAERVWRWCRRNPAVAGLSGGLAVVVVSALVLVTGLYLEANDQRLLAQQSAELAHRKSAEALSESQRANQALAEAKAAAELADRKSAEAEFERQASQTAASISEENRKLAETHAKVAETNARAAAENFALARKAVAECLDLARKHPVFQQPAQQEAKALLLKTAVPYHERFATIDNSRQTRRELTKAGFLSSLEDMQTSAKPEAIETLRKTIPNLERLIAEQPDDRAARTELAVARTTLGYLLVMTGQTAEAMTSLRATRDGYRQLLEEEPGSRDWRFGLGYCEMMLGTLLSHSRRIAESKELCENAAKLLSELASEFPDSKLFAKMEVIAKAQLALTLFSFGQYAQAVAQAEALLPVLRERINDPSLPLMVQMYPMLLETMIGRYKYRQGDRTGLDVQQKSLKLGEALLRSSPGLTELRAMVGMGKIGLAEDLLANNETELAMANARSGLKHVNILNSGPQPPPIYQLAAAEAQQTLGRVQDKMGQVRESLASFEESVRLIETATQALGPIPEAKNLMAIGYFCIGQLQRANGDVSAGRAAQIKARELWCDLVAKHPDSQDYKSRLADCEGVLAKEDLSGSAPGVSSAAAPMPNATPKTKKVAKPRAKTKAQDESAAPDSEAGEAAAKPALKTAEGS